MKYMALFFTIDWCDIFTLRISPQMFTNFFSLHIYRFFKRTTSKFVQRKACTAESIVLFKFKLPTSHAFNKDENCYRNEWVTMLYYFLNNSTVSFQWSFTLRTQTEYEYEDLSTFDRVTFLIKPTLQLSVRNFHSTVLTLIADQQNEMKYNECEQKCDGFSLR